MPIPFAIEQHMEGAALSWLRRDLAVGEPHYSVRDLAEHDGVLEAHLEGLQLAGDDGWELALDGLKWEEPGEFFVAAALALESGDEARLERVMATTSHSEELRRAVISALGWLAWERAGPMAARLLEHEDPFWRYGGVATFEIHRRDPGDRLAAWIDDSDPGVQARALRTVGTLARGDLIDRVAEFVDSEDPTLRAPACRTLALRRGDSAEISQLREIAASDGSHAESATGVLMSVLPLQQACELINELTQGTQRQLRLATIATGLLGIPDSVPWLIEMMKQPPLARVAGESFARITGLRLDQRPFEAEWPEGFEAGPNDDPEDEDVEMDKDENLPFPDPAMVSRWWSEHSRHFESQTRYLLGWEIANPAWLRKILVLGRQRERATAALELALLNPGQPLFEIRANGNRQIKQLGAGRLPTEEYRCNKLEAGPEDDAERAARYDPTIEANP